MEYKQTKLVEEDNTIYEIDLNCMRRKEQKRQQDIGKKEKKQTNTRTARQ